MKLKKCTSGTVVIELDEEFSDITVSAVGELINRGEGFCLSIASIAQEEPSPRELELSEQEQVAAAIAQWESAPISIEFYEDL